MDVMKMQCQMCCGRKKPKKPNERICKECGGEVKTKGVLTPEMNKTAKDWLAITGFEFMHIDEVKAGEMTFSEAFHANVEWLEGVVASAMNLPHGIVCICKEVESE